VVIVNNLAEVKSLALKDALLNHQLANKSAIKEKVKSSIWLKPTTKNKTQAQSKNQKLQNTQPSQN
jgi:hypothetical protein